MNDDEAPNKLTRGKQRDYFLMRAKEKRMQHLMDKFDFTENNIETYGR